MARPHGAGELAVAGGEGERLPSIVPRDEMHAARATPAKQIKFQLTREPSGVLIAVWDSLDDIPEPQPMVELTLETLDLSEEHWDDNGGRGLPIVDNLATAWGFTPDPTAGKWAWARLDT